MQMGGVPKVLINILQNIDRNQFEPFVLMDLYQGELRNDIPKNVKVFTLSKGREEMSKIKAVLFCQLFVRYIKLHILHLFPLLLKSKIDILPDIEVAITHSSLPRLIRSPFKISKKINWFHTDIRWHHSISQGKKIALMMNKCNMTIFGSLHTQQSFENHLGVTVAKKRYVHNAFNGEEVINRANDYVLEKEFLQNKKNLFVSVGRLAYQKGYDMLIDIHQELIAEGWEHSVIILGDGPDYRKLHEKITKKSLSQTFFLLGNRNNPYPYIKLADYYIQPSRYESYSIVLGETLILGKPIITTNAGGVKELLEHNRTAYIINFDKNEIKQAMKEFMTKDDLLKKIAKNQNEFNYEKYNNKIYQEINKVFLDLV